VLVYNSRQISELSEQFVSLNEAGKMGACNTTNRRSSPYSLKKDISNPAKNRMTTVANIDIDTYKHFNSSDISSMRSALNTVLLFSKLQEHVKDAIMTQMYERQVFAGDIIVQQGDIAGDNDEMYVIKEGIFEVLYKRNGIQFKVNSLKRGQCFGEIALLFNCPRAATVAAITDGSMWILKRESFQQNIESIVNNDRAQISIFMNSVPVLTNLTKEAKMALVDAFDVEIFQKGDYIVHQGTVGDRFYIIKDGEAHVIKNGVMVNTLFQADFFGEAALIHDEPRQANIVVSSPKVVVLSIDRVTFKNILGPQESRLQKNTDSKSARIAKMVLSASLTLEHRTNVMLITSTGKHIPLLAHRCEVEELIEDTESVEFCMIVKGLVGKGAYGSVYRVFSPDTKRFYALKRIPKKKVLKCKQYVFSEQNISKNILNGFCVRQYASFQDTHHLYMLFDYMTSDLMRLLRKTCIKYNDRNIFEACFNMRDTLWVGFKEHIARFYVACIVLALERLHVNNIIYRDLKPENVLLDKKGYAKLGDFGLSKHVHAAERTYTFCGTPAYIAPEIINGHGYSFSVDWWSLGVLTYVLLTAMQPFNTPFTSNIMEIMHRINDDSYIVKYPVYISKDSKDFIAKLLQRKPYNRLGFNMKKIESIKEHPWFNGFDWQALASRRLHAPSIASNLRNSLEFDKDAYIHDNPSPVGNDLQEQCNKEFEIF
jgi:cGMP-dependent protein kinase 2